MNGRTGGQAEADGPDYDSLSSVSPYFRPGQDLVMTDHAVEAHQRGPGFGLYHRQFPLLAGKGADGIHRVPERQHQELDLIRFAPAEQVEPAEAGQPVQLGTYRMQEMPGNRPGPPSPQHCRATPVPASQAPGSEDGVS